MPKSVHSTCVDTNNCFSCVCNVWLSFHSVFRFQYGGQCIHQAIGMCVDLMVCTHLCALKDSVSSLYSFCCVMHYLQTHLCLGCCYVRCCVSSSVVQHVLSTGIHFFASTFPHWCVVCYVLAPKYCVVYMLLIIVCYCMLAYVINRGMMFVTYVMAFTWHSH
jgi:hypothetical protein